MSEIKSSSLGPETFGQAEALREMSRRVEDRTEKPLTKEETETLESARKFIENNSEILGKIIGIEGLDIRVGQAWTTNLETGEVTVDPSFFVREGYRPEWANYGMLHELTAHLRETVLDPALNRQAMREDRRGPEHQVFYNIMTDIAGNKMIHRMLPNMKKVAESAYSEKLFPESDYKKEPRHIQFLNQIIRTEMIEGSSTGVKDEVAEAIKSLRDYEGRGIDVVGIATDPKTESRERFKLQKELIFPVYQRLLDEDKKDPNFKNEKNGEGEEGEGGEPGQPGEGKPSGERSGGQPDFSEYYDEIKDKHPEPFSEEEEEKIQRDASQIEKERHAKERSNQAGSMKGLEKQTGHRAHDIMRYRRELASYGETIEEMEEFFDKIISQRVSLVRSLTQRGEEGMILDPAHLAQTYTDVRAGVEAPPAFLDYKKELKTRNALGGYDLYLVVDESGSMQGEKATMAARSAMIFMEGLDLFEKKIKETEESERLSLDLDIRTQVMTFGERSETIKPLSATLAEKERLDTFFQVVNASGGSTNDYLSLEEIVQRAHKDQRGGDDLDRKKIVVVVTDGGSSSPSLARNKIGELRKLGFVVMGVGIEDRSAESLYAPDGRTINDPKQLPKTLIEIMQKEMS